MFLGLNPLHPSQSEDGSYPNLPVLQKGTKKKSKCSFVFSGQIQVDFFFFLVDVVSSDSVWKLGIEYKRTDVSTW